MSFTARQRLSCLAVTRLRAVPPVARSRKLSLQARVLPARLTGGGLPCVETMAAALSIQLRRASDAMTGPGIHCPHTIARPCHP